MFFLLYRHIPMTVFLTILRFPITFRRFPMILQNLSKSGTNVAEHFPKMSDDDRRFPKIPEDCPRLSRKARRCSHHNTNESRNNLRDKLDISDIIDHFTSQDMDKNATLVPDVALNEFYEWCISCKRFVSI